MTIFFPEVSIDPDLTHSRLYDQVPAPHALIHPMLGREIFDK